MTALRPRRAAARKQQARRPTPTLIKSCAGATAGAGAYQNKQLRAGSVRQRERCPGPRARTDASVVLTNLCCS